MQSQIKSEFQLKLRPSSEQPLGAQSLVVGAIAAFSLVVGEAGSLSAQAASLTHWNFDPAANQLEITVKDGTTPRYFLMAQPARIVVDLPGTAIGDVSVQQTYAGVVRQIRVSQFEPGLTRIVMEISPGVSLAPGQVKLQKVGDRATQASNSRWVLSPLVTKSLSANAVSVQPSSVQPTMQPIRPVSAIAPVAPVSLNSSPPPQTPAVIPNNLPAPPPVVALPAASSSTITASAPTAANDGKPAASTTAAVNPTTPVALAPVLPAVPTQRAETTTPLPPNAVTPIDPNVAIDTSSGVTIAVPSPTTVASTNVAPQTALPQGESPQVVTAADVPVTLAVRPATVAPSVSVPPLSDRVQSDRVQSDRGTSQLLPSVPSRQPEAAEPLPALPSNRQPSVSVSPPIRVGTPSLVLPNPQAEIELAPALSASGTALAAVTVPPLQRLPRQPVSAPSTPLPAASASYDANTIRQAPLTTPLPVTAGASYDASTMRQQSSSAANLAPPLKLAPLPSPVALSIATPTYDATTVRQPPTRLAASPIVEFGQPLPATPGAARNSQPLVLVNQSPGVRQALKPTAPNVLLPAGTTLSLLYPGNAALSLRSDRPQQEVLMLQTDLRDASGTLLAPAGSLVTGRFETTTAGSQFVTQAIALTGRSLTLVAQSDALAGTHQVTGNNLARNSGIGVLAGGVLGAIGGSTGLGAIGGAAAGAAATFITAPKPAMIQPGQLIQVRLTQDLSSPQ